MGVFAKYRRFYREPERISPEIARLNRFNALLEKERSNIERYSLSPATKKILQEYQPSVAVKDREKTGPKAVLIAAALASFTERDFADPKKRAAYRELRSMQGGQQKVKSAAFDGRSFHPFKQLGFASDVYGKPARTVGVSSPLLKNMWVPHFHNSWSVIPCIERVIRREVLFAFGKGGRGYRVNHRRKWSSGIPC